MLPVVLASIADRRLTNSNCHAIVDERVISGITADTATFDVRPRGYTVAFHPGVWRIATVTRSAEHLFRQVEIFLRHRDIRGNMASM